MEMREVGPPKVKRLNSQKIIFFVSKIKYKCEVQTKCYRINTILSFAPPFFKRLPPGHRKKPVKNVLKGGGGGEAEVFLAKM